MHFKPVFLATDIFIYILVIVALIFFFWGRTKEHIRAPWRQVLHNKLAIVSLTVLAFYVVVGLLDSVHFQEAVGVNKTNGAIHYSGKVVSLLDLLIKPIGSNDEKTYSAPLATHSYSKETVIDATGQQQRVYPQLKYAGLGLAKKNYSAHLDVLLISLQGIVVAVIIGLIILFLLIAYRFYKRKKAPDLTLFPTHIRVFFMTLMVLLLITTVALYLGQSYHLFGTDKVGQDVFYQALKSIRTGLVIGTITTLVMLPFALAMGTMAGYYGGLIDDIIQYIYTTLSSIPGVLLIAASILSLQIFMSTHPEYFQSIAARADARLLALCLILGVTSWTSLCRLLRAETLKLREMDYVQAAKALGVNNRKILFRHVLPNVMHIILITVVLDFSTLVLAEAVLTYVGVGVDPTTMSWGNMINSARLELARDPVVWWPLLAAFIFMFVLVLAANLFADAVRDAFDPRIRQYAAK